MELREVTVAVVRGGGFHAKDFLFEKARAELAQSVQERIREHQANAAFSLSVSIDEDGDIKIEDSASDRFEALITPRGLVWRLYRVPFSDLTLDGGNLLAPVAAILDELTLHRSQSTQWDMYGVRLDFAIPLLEPNAVKCVESLGLGAVNRNISSSFGVAEYERLKYESSFEVDEYEVEVTLASTGDRKAVVLLVDSRSSNTKRFSKYSEFLRSALNTVAGKLPAFTSHLLSLQGIDEQYLKKGVR